MSKLLIQMENISKEFPGVKALQGVSFDLRAGEVHALVGENGAGKSTLMKVLTGVYTKDSGSIKVRNREVSISTVRDSQELGIVMIHQELNLMNHLTVAQNIFIGREKTGRLRLFLNDTQLNSRARDIMRRLNIAIDPQTRVGDLAVAKQQMVEIAKALSYNSEILIMDEPTASLAESEIADLFRVIRMLRDEGKGIIYISHRLEELKQISDRITVMRDGSYIDTLDTSDVSTEHIINLMVGRELFIDLTDRRIPENAPAALEVHNIDCGKMVRNVSFKVHQGEILGIAGLMGAGRTETARAIYGADRKTSGEIYVRGRKVSIKSPFDAVSHGIAYLSEDRKRFGLMLGLNVETNISIASMKDYLFGRLFIQFSKARGNAETMVKSLDIKTPSVLQLTRYLSGGNQQKVVLAKWLTRNCDIFIFDEPTRGIDVGAKQEIYRLLNQLADAGKAIIMISSELAEIIRICNRVVVMCEGRVTGEAEAQDMTQKTIMGYATKRGN